MRPAVQVIEKKAIHPEDHPDGNSPPERWICTRCRREIDGESTVCRVHEGLYIFYHAGCLDAGTGR
ncbi:MAG: hypothetical protein QGH70_00715 [Nitrospinota bacterium]|jgi:hypothetical protein|nr:hypothetical protein [Nitrospinota bacterium]MDP6482352.1 hypothetical protein [Nitrospinota bacterium]MDP6619319.1 hypothetical protein [Nitrospinota bacterium]